MSKCPSNANHMWRRGKTLAPREQCAICGATRPPPKHQYQGTTSQIVLSGPPLCCCRVCGLPRDHEVHQTEG